MGGGQHQGVPRDGTKIVFIPFFGAAADLKNDRKGTDVVIQRFKEMLRRRKRLA